MVLHIEERRNARQQWGGGAQHSTRNYWRWLASRAWLTDGSSALNAPPPDMPALKVVKGQRWHFDAGAVIGGGLIQIIRAFTLGATWFYDLLFLGVVYKRVRHDLVYETWRQVHSRLGTKQCEGAVKVGSRTPAPSQKQLPAPDNTMVGLLPARCAA
jgi:hypothetical protein